MTRVGLVARANLKGLGTQTLSASRGYPFASTLLVLDNDRRAPEHPEWYPDAHTVTWDPLEYQFPYGERDTVDAFLEDVDVVFSVETLYDQHLVDRCRSRRIKTVIQGNPEFYLPSRPRPDVWTWPTAWRLDEVPSGPVIPVPVMDGCWASPAPLDASKLEVVHVAGHRAHGDRNGTELFFEALRYVTAPVNVRVYGQNGQFPALPTLPPNVSVELWPDGVVDRWSMYDEAHLLVMPRRYGGLCLPVQEAMTAGLAVSMTECSPNTETWPVKGLRWSKGRLERVVAGNIDTYVADPRRMGRQIDYLATNRNILEEFQARSREWAETHTWDALRPQYEELFA